MKFYLVFDHSRNNIMYIIILQKKFVIKFCLIFKQATKVKKIKKLSSFPFIRLKNFKNKLENEIGMKINIIKGKSICHLSSWFIV